MVVEILTSDDPVTDGERGGAMYTRAWIHAQLDELEVAMELILEAEELMPRNRDFWFWADTAMSKPYVLARMGQRDEALILLEALMREPGWVTSWELYYGPWWDFFRDDPRFVALATPENMENNE
jgi:hypothetical protein